MRSRHERARVRLPVFEPTTKWQWAIRAACLGILVAGFLYLAAGSLVGAFTFRSFDATTTGVVVERQGGGRSCHSLVAYSAPGAPEAEYVTRSDNCPPVGESVQVRYDSTAPHRATANGPVRTYGGNLLLGLAFLFSATVTVSLIGRPPHSPEQERSTWARRNRQTGRTARRRTRR